MNELRHRYGLRALPVMSAAPALATMSSFFDSASRLRTPSAVAELTRPTTTSTPSLCSTFCTAGTPVCGVSPSSASTVVTE
nr:hypothetical protein [Pseudonocardia acaciae]